MPRESHHRQLRNEVERQAQRKERAERERHQWIAQTAYIGTLGLVLIIPVIFGAYLGVWLDEQLAGYSVSWTVSLIVVGLVTGLINVYLLFRD